MSKLRTKRGTQFRQLLPYPIRNPLCINGWKAIGVLFILQLLKSTVFCLFLFILVHSTQFQIILWADFWKFTGFSRDFFQIPIPINKSFFTVFITYCWRILFEVMIMKTNETKKERTYYETLFKQYKSVVDFSTCNQMLGGINTNTLYHLLQEKTIDNFYLCATYYIPKTYLIDFLLSEKYAQLIQSGKIKNPI